MSPKIISFRIFARWTVALTIVLGLVAVLLTLIFYSNRLIDITGEGWTVFGGGILALGTGLGIILRALAQNPSDRTKISEEE